MLFLITEKKKAALITVLAVMLAVLASVWPLRLYWENFIFQGHGEIQRVSETVDADNNAGEYFTAQYAHLQTLGVYIDSVDYGDELAFQLFHPENGGNVLVAEETVSLADATLPGYVSIPVDAELEPGEMYIYLVKGRDSGFRVGYESAEVSADPEAPVYDVGFYHDTTINGLALATKLTYRMPLTKFHSLILGLIILAAGLMAICAVTFYYQRRPQKNTHVRVITVLRRVLTPVILVVSGCLLSFIALQKFDERLSDNLLYVIGVLMTAGICLYALWHDRTDLPDSMTPKIWKESWPHLVIIVSLSMILVCCTAYMNATNDFLHYVSEYRIVCLFCLIMLAMGRKRDNLHPAVPIVGALSAAAGVIVYFTRRLSPEEAEFAENNQLLRWQLASCVSLAIVVTATVVMLIRMFSTARRRERRFIAAPYLPVFVPLIIFAALLFIFRNGRHWITVMIVMYALLYLRFAFWNRRGEWLRDLCYGVSLHFVLAVTFSMLRRYYFAFIYSRFPMQFHTVTVTAYYLLIVEAAVMTLFLMRLWELMDGSHHPFRYYAARLWKEALLFGTASSYMLMSLSRAGIFELAAFVILTAVLVFRKTAGRRRHFGILRAILTMTVVTIVTLPVIFTNQRILPAVVGDPVWYDEVEPYPDELIRHPRWNDKWFMSAEVFIRDFGDRVIGGGLGSRIYDGNDWGANQVVDKADKRVTGKLDIVRDSMLAMDGDIASPIRVRIAEPMQIRSGAVLLAAERDSQAAENEKTTVSDATDSETGVSESAISEAEEGTKEVGSLESGDYSNGRLDLWKAYLRQLTPTGHYNMGATLPNGQAAVHAHNIILQMAFDCGPLVGILFAVLLVLILAAAGIYYYRQTLRDRAEGSNGYALFLLLTVLGFTITGMVEWIFTFCNPFCIIYMLAIAPVIFWDGDMRNLTDRQKDNLQTGVVQRPR
ncbi:hypothetical protein SAMN02745687_01287 [Lachnospiraceae bacterium NK3A20]|nr:hypothetical protein SAMN02745687_01287 [Lachnospiraceae bacterium NK3A20]